VLRGVAEIERARLQGERVAAPAEVPDGQLQVRMTRHQLRLEVIEILHPLRERIADQHDAIVRPQLERSGSRSSCRLRQRNCRARPDANQDANEQDEGLHIDLPTEILGTPHSSSDAPGADMLIAKPSMLIKKLRMLIRQLPQFI
jgi:hypothetical protein